MPVSGRSKAAAVKRAVTPRAPDPCAEVVLRFGDDEYVAMPLRVIDSPELVVCMVDPADKSSMMRIDQAPPGADGQLSIYWYDDTGSSHRRVLCQPYRFRDGATVYLMFIVLPDGV
jgi:hypothetical protein